MIHRIDAGDWVVHTNDAGLEAFEKAMSEELEKCANDPNYFAEKYCKVKPNKQNDNNATTT
jgi:hypothetical protein